MNVKEKRHRLPRQSYRGQRSVAFKLCFKGSRQLLIRPQTAALFAGILASAAARADCIVPVYCFMPDHQHLIITGIGQASDIWKTIVGYKQSTGFFLSVYHPHLRWQKDFYDHVIRTHQNIANEVRCILDNPVRKGLVSTWEGYPFKGSVGCRMEDVLNGII